MKTWDDLDNESKAIIEELIEDVSHLPWFEDLDHSGLHRCSPSGDSLLHSAAILGRTEAIEILVSLGLDVNQRGGQGYSPLHEAASQGKMETYQKLLQLGADVSLMTEDGWTASDLLKEVGLPDTSAR